MGFDEFLDENAFEGAQILRAYVDDQGDYEKLVQLVEEKDDPEEKLFIFNVTMQNHSSYAQGWNNLEKTVTLPDVQKAADTTAEQYLSLIRASDDALRDLIEHYSQSEEPTMVVFFGDHQPPLKNAFYEQLYNQPS